MIYVAMGASSSDMVAIRFSDRSVDYVPIYADLLQHLKWSQAEDLDMGAAVGEHHAEVIRMPGQRAGERGSGNQPVRIYGSCEKHSAYPSRLD